MGAPFSDITLYVPIPHLVGSDDFKEETSLQNFICDLYVRRMNGYKPPQITRITLQPAYHNIWTHTWKIGSLVSIAPYFNYDEYKILSKKEKYQYILDLIQTSVLQLSEEYHWDKSIFVKAYEDIINTNFNFKIEYPAKLSRDKKKTGSVCIDKTETMTAFYIVIKEGSSVSKIKFFDKKNTWWYDCAYLLAKEIKWFDSNRFGISYNKKKIEIFYSLNSGEVLFFENGNQIPEIEFGDFFLFEK